MPPTTTTTCTQNHTHAGSQPVAMRTGSSTLNFLLGDHLGSTSVTTSSTGTSPKYQLYKPFGEVRYTSSSLPTKYTFTGQYSNVSDFGLMYYGARWYDVSLGRFAQADTIIPGAGNPLAWDRFAYVNNNPLRYTDPSGHCKDDDYVCLNKLEELQSKYYIVINDVNGLWTLSALQAIEKGMRIFEKAIGKGNFKRNFSSVIFNVNSG